MNINNQMQSPQIAINSFKYLEVVKEEENEDERQQQRTYFNENYVESQQYQNIRNANCLYNSNEECQKEQWEFIIIKQKSILRDKQIKFQLKSPHTCHSQQELCTKIQMTFYKLIFKIIMLTIHASQNGSFAIHNTLTIPLKGQLRILLHSKKLFNLQPILITSISQPLKSPKCLSPKKPFPGYRKILKGELTHSLPFPFYWTYNVVQHNIAQDGGYQYDLKCRDPGTQFVRFIWVQWDTQQVVGMGDPLYFIVESELNLTSLTVQTILPNLVKDYDFDGYSAFHFCPIQEVTNSLYCIKDQLKLKHFRSLEELDAFIKHSQKMWFVDIVLNHTSPESEWLNDEECVFNERTVPQLTSALELDLALEKVSKYDEIERVVRSLNLEEYFLISQEYLNRVSNGRCDLQNEDEDDDDNIFEESPQQKCCNKILTLLENEGVTRNGVQINKFTELVKEYSQDTIKQALIIANNYQKKKALGYVEEAIANIQSYYKMEGRMQRYFVKLNKWYAAYNGWVLNINPDENFVTSKNFHYLRRTINHWHVVKLRFAEDTKLLFDRYLQYIQMMASVFHGIRLDNAHSTDYKVLKCLIKKARKVNPNLIVFAECFGMTRDQEVKYMSEIGINAFVRELIHSENTHFIAQTLRDNQYCQFYKPPIYLVYDQSHDNEPIIAKYGAEHLVCLVSALSFSNVFRGTNRMVDQFYDKHISVVFEKKKYPKQFLNLIEIRKRRIRFCYPLEKENQKVLLKGSFDNWNSEIPLSYNQETKQYLGYLELDIGEYEYKYIVNDEWICNPDEKQRNNNNIIEINPINGYQQLTFIRQLNIFEFKHTYIQDFDQYLIITRTNDDHQMAQVIVICFQNVKEIIQLVGNIINQQYQYSYLQQYCSIESDDELTQNIHFIDTTTQYSTINQNQLILNAPKSYVVICQCQLNLTNIHQFLQQEQYEYDLYLLYKPLVNQYEIPNCGPLRLAGLYGVYQYIKEIQTKDHALIQHISQGDWLIEYYIKELPQIQDILKEILQLPQIYRPYFFIKIVTQLVQYIEHKYSDNQCQFFRQLEILTKSYNLTQSNKLRYIFMSFKGILLSNHRYIEAKQIIKKYSDYFRNGLLPNTIQPLRYNSRDTCFWWLKAIRDYIEFTDDYSLVQEFKDTIFNIFQSHANGITYKEQYVHDSTEKEGQMIKLYMDTETGFIMGGNYKNCLTWMDVIGSSPANMGYPAASRDGAPIECTALLKVCLDFLHKVTQLGKFHQPGVKLQNRCITWKAWSDFIGQHFERCYWVPIDSTQFSKHQINEKYLRRKGVYKDVYKCSKPRSEYQLRPNSCIAISLAPELFQKQHVIHHLAVVEQNLIQERSQGVSTLDHIASEYSGKLYQQETTNFATSKSFSLNNGSEFIFLLGYYLKALLKIHKTDISKFIFYAYLTEIREHLLKYFTIPEYTDANGTLIGYQNSMVSAGLIRDAIEDKNKLDK